jgi:hypothetical protein
METKNQLTNKQNLIRILGLAAIILLLIQLRGCIRDMNTGRTQESVQPLRSDTVIKYKYLPKWFYLKMPTQQIVDSTPAVLPPKVDTLAILKKFYTEYCYRDTVQDTNIIAVSEIEVFENKIRNHNLSYKLLRPEKTITITNTVEKPFKPLLLVGVSISQDKQFSFGLGPQVLFISKRRQSVGLGYDVINKRLNANLYLPLQIRP